MYVFMQSSCLYNSEDEHPEHLTLICYNKPLVQTEEEMRTGLNWLFSYLGAALLENEKGIQVKDDKINIKLEYLGFSDQARSALKKIIYKLKESEEYRKKGAIDAGRFFGLIFNSSWHYYSITGVANNYNQFKSRINFSNQKKLALDSSSISKEGRLIRYSLTQGNIQQSFFIAEEGKGYFSDSSFVAIGYHEVFDYMPNGQPRFAIYSIEGNLIAGNDHVFSKAGKPAKCMWCHESKMQPLFKPSPEINGYVSMHEFEEDQKKFNNDLEQFHATNGSKLIYANKQDHSQGEFIYLNFFEPSVERLAQEWNLTTATVKEKLKKLSTHTNPEFPALQSVYYRSEVEPYSPFKTLKTCGDARDVSGYEPNYLE